MNKKVLLILVDGMRPDSMDDIPFMQKLKETSTYTMDAQTVCPPITMPGHFSLFLSVSAERHGVTGMTYTPADPSLRGLCEQTAAAGLKNAFFYSWEPLRDLSRPDSLAYASFISGLVFGFDVAGQELTEQAIAYIPVKKPDFVFLYLGLPDAVGHADGWMTSTYMNAVAISWKQIEQVMEVVGDDYVVIITADHGGHDRMHGLDCPEDMTIPVFLHGNPFEAGKEIHGVNIMDIAPTIAALLQVEPAAEWEGRIIQ